MIEQVRLLNELTTLLLAVGTSFVGVITWFICTCK